MHVPTLPTKSTWETPIAASREIVDAIADAADSAVDAATSAVRSVRRRRTARHAVVAQWRWILATAVVLAALVVWRRRSGESPAERGADAHRSAADRATGVRDDLASADAVTDRLVNAGANRSDAVD